MWMMVVLSSIVLVGCTSEKEDDASDDVQQVQNAQSGTQQAPTGVEDDDKGDDAVATGTMTNTWSADADDDSDDSKGEEDDDAAKSADNSKKAGFSLADVQAHNTPESCWAIIRDDVYDLTAWINKHPGGDKNILRLCGLDGTAMFDKKHGGQENPENVLKGFEIGKYLR